MSKTYYPAITLCLSFTLVFLGGCASTKEKVFKAVEMKTMGEIYGEKFGSMNEVDDAAKKRAISSDLGDVVDFTRTAATELEALFPELPNPKLTLYVFPHITASNLPVPGYTTVFRMYESAPFAMPGERQVNVWR